MNFIYFAIFLAGSAALTWEILWMHFTSLAIGVSAHAAAIVLSTMMLGIAIGSYFIGPFLKSLQFKKIIWFLALLEIFIGAAGLFLPTGFHFLEQMDTRVFQSAPDSVLMVQIVGIILLIGLPSAFMGMTVPVYARIAADFKLSLPFIYALNVAGAALGILAASFFYIPKLGIIKTVQVSAVVNVLAAVVIVLAARSYKITNIEAKSSDSSNASKIFPFGKTAFTVFATGFATFALEVVWFRSLRASLQATTESFAIILFTTLIALAVGSYLSIILKRSGRVPLSVLLAFGGFLVFEVTPFIERFDLVTTSLSGPYELYSIKRFLLVLITLGPPMCALGIGLPWLMESYNKTEKVHVLYAINTVGAVAGSLCAAWLFLPTIGFVKGSWVAAGFLVAASFVLAGGKERAVCFVLGLMGFLTAFTFRSDVGALRVQGVAVSQKYVVLAIHEGPDVTTSVIENEHKVRQLYIDGFSASDEGRMGHYMDWMGRLPMILHPSPQNALVICFGTGQTANAVRLEGSRHLDIVDVNPAVFGMAHLFSKNQNVLEDPGTHRVVMDGRAYLRRTTRNYDVVTLEPMPPTFAGSNALYSLEFYLLIKSRLNDGGVAAQWLPFHLVDPVESASIVATFSQVFSDVVLWIDPVSTTGILLGFKRDRNDSKPVEWYGLGRNQIQRSLPGQIISRQIFEKDVLNEFAKSAKIITDDNQLLAYGYGRMKWWGRPDRDKYVLGILNSIALKPKSSF